jgi:NAD(P)-dependent dehydrogenase (short-subunit alcohol dehydrogenase family)
VYHTSFRSARACREPDWTWWRGGVLYQVYPRSFADSNCDGIGDLSGITAHLDYLEWLGVDTLWLNPTTPSPNDDWGYDVADHKDARVDRLDLAVWNRLITTNLTGQFLACKHGARHLLNAGGGAIVCIGSNCGSLGMAVNEPAYSASKGGIFAMMRVMANDYAQSNIRVNMVIPGFIDTPMSQFTVTDPELMKLWSDPIPLKRPGTADECASAILWLASDEASYCVGTALVVDGGQSAV